MTQLTSANELFDRPARRRYDELTLPVSRHRVRIQSITEKEYSEYTSATVAAKGNGLRLDRLEDANRRFIALCLVDAQGNRILPTKEAHKLSEWDAGDSAYLYTRCSEHCGINKGDIEELVGNSEPIPVDDSPSN